MVMFLPAAYKSCESVEDSAIAKSAHRVVEVIMLLDIPLKYLRSTQGPRPGPITYGKSRGVLTSS